MMHPLFLGKLGMTEILILLVIVVIFFGGKKIPELMRGMGRGVREFKDAIENKPQDEPAAPAAKKDDATAPTAAKDEASAAPGQKK